MRESTQGAPEFQSGDTARKSAETDAFSDCAALGAAVGADNGPNDDDLQAVINRWPDLPGELKAGIMALVRAVGDVG